MGHHAQLHSATKDAANSIHTIGRAIYWLTLEGHHTALDEALCLARRLLPEPEPGLRCQIMVVWASTPARPQRVIWEASYCATEGIEIMAIGTSGVDHALLRNISHHDPVMVRLVWTEG